MHVLTITTTGGTTEIHLLNPGEFMTPFGGRKSGLHVGKTASLVTRTYTSHGLTDCEYDIFDKNVWEWIRECINQSPGIGEVRAATPEEE